jgi:RNA polymerase sigma-70 factor, ECF subfamily
VTDAVRAAQAGDPAAFRVLYDAHVGRVHALCLRLAGDRLLAEELTQDVFVRAWHQLGSYRGESAFSTWLHRVAINEVMGRFRSRGRRGRHESAEDLDLLDPVAGRSAGPGPAIDLDQAIAGLPDGARRVFVLHDVEGYQHDEIAQMTGIAVGTSKAQLHRARRLLRERLER